MNNRLVANTAGLFATFQMLFCISTSVFAQQQESHAFCSVLQSDPEIPAFLTGLRTTIPEDAKSAYESIQKECENLATSMEQLGKNKDTCSLDEYQKLQEQISGVDTQYQDFGKKFNITIPSELNGTTHVSIGLNEIFNNHFVGCEKISLFPMNPNACFTEDCKEAIEKINAIPITQEGCNSFEAQREMIQATEGWFVFTFEQNLIKKAEDLHRDACIDANISPILTGIGGDLYKKDYPQYEKAEKLNHELETILKNPEITAENCAVSKYKNFVKLLKERDDAYSKLPGSFNKSRNGHSLMASYIKHINQCIEAKLWTVDTHACISPDCIARITFINSQPINKQGCNAVLKKATEPGEFNSLELAYVTDITNERLIACQVAGAIR